MQKQIGAQVRRGNDHFIFVAMAAPYTQSPPRCSYLDMPHRQEHTQTLWCLLPRSNEKKGGDEGDGSTMVGNHGLPPFLHC
jgi:hypothetical protein